MVHCRARSDYSFDEPKCPTGQRQVISSIAGHEAQDIQVKLEFDS